MRVKAAAGVRLFGVVPQIFFAYYVSYHVYEEKHNSQNCVITSARDGVHMKGSAHYDGRAIDIRTWGFENYSDVEDVVIEIRNRLTIEFQVVHEKDHIHIEFDIQSL